MCSARLLGTVLLGQATQSHVEIWSPLFSFSIILVVYMLFSSLCVMCLLIVLLLNSSAQHVLIRDISESAGSRFAGGAVGCCSISKVQTK
jgi:hypothetical protein